VHAEKEKWNSGGDRDRDRDRRELPALLCPATLPAYFDEESYPHCFDETWDSTYKRRALWGAVRTAVPPERRVTHILLSSVSSIVADAGPGMCNAPGTENLRSTLREARASTVQAKVYALFAVSDADFSETDKVPDVVAWNKYCATCWNEKFDGVAINNEHFSTVKCDANGTEEFLLTRLHEAKQLCHEGGLELHMSLGWHWGWCSVTDEIPNEIAWAPPGEPPVTRPANEHFIDIADSVDAQVSWNVPSTMASRAQKAGALYAQSEGKPFWVLAYTNPNDLDCRYTFFPTVGGCATGDRTEAGMWSAFDEMVDLLADLLGVVDAAARGGIHYFRGSYGTGMPDWPTHIGPNVIPFMCAEKETFQAAAGLEGFQELPPVREKAHTQNRGGVFQKEHTAEENP